MKETTEVMMDQFAVLAALPNAMLAPLLRRLEPSRRQIVLRLAVEMSRSGAGSDFGPRLQRQLDERLERARSEEERATPSDTPESRSNRQELAVSTSPRALHIGDPELLPVV